MDLHLLMNYLSLDSLESFQLVLTELNELKTVVERTANTFKCCDV